MNYKLLLVSIFWPFFVATSDHKVSQVVANESSSSAPRISSSHNVALTELIGDNKAPQVIASASSSSAPMISSSHTVALTGLIGDHVEILKTLIDRFDTTSAFLLRKIQYFERRLNQIELKISELSSANQSGKS